MKQSKKPTKDNPYYWIEKYALAQCHVGIEHTLARKREVVGYESLIDAPINKLKKLIYVLRQDFKNNVDILNGDKMLAKAPSPPSTKKKKGEVCESIHRY
tara:strand:+ start:44677 stop:44976 length:300 start_codon:yes stop_codon:yes gene_type:complete